MGSVIREFVIEAPVARVWAVVSDFAEGPKRMSGGALAGCRLVEPDVRELTFASGAVARERLIARDEPARRMVWGWVGDDVVHDNTSMQVFADGESRARLVWIHDTLPDELTGWLATTMDQLVPGIQEALKA
jgi:polyketide cyclase/dehydrase/lipid transport protein